jgi:recombinational DNA repair protein RecR
VIPKKWRRHNQERKHVVERIRSSAEEFKVCDQCFSISWKRAGRCKVCGAYRFDKSPALVKSITRRMATSPFPRSAGFAPRLDIERNA